MVEGAHKIWKRPNTPFYFGFTGNMEVRVTILLYTLFLTWNAIESVTRLKGYKRLCTYGISITFYKLFNLVTHPATDSC